VAQAANPNRRPIRHVAFYFRDGLEDSLQQLEDAGIMNMAGFVAGAAFLVDFLERFPPIDKLEISFSGNVPQPIACNLVGICSRAKNIHLTSHARNGAAELIIASAVRDALRDQPFLEKFKTSLINPLVLRALGTVLPTCPKLTSFQLTDEFFLPDPFAIQEEDARAIQSIMMAPGLNQLSVTSFNFENEHITSLFCEGIRSTHLSDLTLSKSNFPNEVVATALASTKIESLTFTRCHLLPPFLRELSRSLSCPSNMIKTLVFESVTNDLVSLLRGSRQWMVQDLTMTIDQWSPAFDTVLSEFVSNHDELRKLTIVLVWGYAGPIIASPALLGALDSKTLRLEEFKLHQVRIDNRPLYYDHMWYDQVRHILELNSLRRMLASQLSSIATGEDLVAALETIPFPFVYEFIRRNEFNLVGLLRAFVH
jgi:hypothetical protein